MHRRNRMLLINWRVLALSFLVLYSSVLFSCVGNSRYPDGYTPRPWLLVCDRGSFLAYRLNSEELDEKGDFESVMSQLPPRNVRWKPLSELEKVVSDDWGETGTTILVLRVRTDPTQDDTARILRVLLSHGLMAGAPEASIHDIIERHKRASAFLASLPEHLPKRERD